ncbi:MAG TPA: hypothetical protein VH025_10540 [Solirubrobacteraceae bacterium]|nr:hypothetical protein [Solirubrobacteraceae bacterium]
MSLQADPAGVHAPEPGTQPGPYAALLAHAERELELAGGGELEPLEALAPSWAALVAALPQQPPAAARPTLERALLVHERTRIELIRMQQRIVGEISAVGTARRAGDRYGETPGRGRRVDRSA